MVGDRRSDLETGADLGVVPLLVRTGYGRDTEADLPPDFAARGGRAFDDVAAAVAWVLHTAPVTGAGPGTPRVQREEVNGK